ncbi:MAG: dihydroorotate dehydrogenase electron transfer subunit [Euryarchaeota archaeon]|nr:dihydroorotate dehydrogenase electron transfer subunit [Euryarchaeota archaeon]
MYVRNVTITDIKKESTGIYTLFFDHSFKFVPGQYVMVWIRGVDEIPMSLSYANGITVRVVGDATAALCDLGAGDTLGIRGPYGNGFKSTQPPTLLVAGGVGAAPLASYADAFQASVMTILGARTKDELLFVKRFKDAGPLLTATDDGSAGHAGSVVDLLRHVRGYNEILCCGPEKMMYAVLQDALARSIPSQFSLHRYVKCGIGLCGACCIDESGLRTCVDGPVFTETQLSGGEFGTYMRDASGRKREL